MIITYRSITTCFRWFFIVHGLVCPKYCFIFLLHICTHVKAFSYCKILLPEILKVVLWQTVRKCICAPCERINILEVFYRLTACALSSFNHERLIIAWRWTVQNTRSYYCPLKARNFCFRISNETWTERDMCTERFFSLGIIG